MHWRPDAFLLLLDRACCRYESSGRRRAELINRIRDEGHSILLIEHDMKLVMSLSDKIYVVDYGGKIAEGSPRESARSCGDKSVPG